MRRDQLESTLHDDLGDHVWGVGVLTPEDTPLVRNRLAEYGDAEVGSITKGVTGLLYVDALGRGEVTDDDRLEQHLPLAGCPAGEVTLGAVSRHASGLPRLPVAPDMLRRSWRMVRHQANPYGDSLETLLEQTRATKVGRARPAYSNLGFQLLGHALAAAAGTTYAGLVEQRVAGPLGLGSWYLPGTPAQLRPTAVHGVTRRGRPAAPWTGEGLGPAGGLRSSLSDMARFAQALLDRTAPGVTALDPVADFQGPARIGAGWLTTTTDGRAVTWHNGGTGGYRAFLGLDRERGRAVVVLSGRAVSVDPLGLRLLATA